MINEVIVIFRPKYSFYQYAIYIELVYHIQYE